MIFTVIAIGAVLIVAAVRDSQSALFAALKDDVPAFAIWAAALFAVGALGFIPGMKTPARGLAGLIITVLILSNYSAILTGFKALAGVGSSGTSLASTDGTGTTTGSTASTASTASTGSTVDAGAWSPTGGATGGGLALNNAGASGIGADTTTGSTGSAFASADTGYSPSAFIVSTG